MSWGATSGARLGLLLLALTVASWPGLAASEHGAVPRDVPSDGDEQVAQSLKALCQKHRLPALAGAIVTTSGLRSIAVAGVRKTGDQTPATTRDRWHLGSDTKAMTATLVGVLVERGLIRWDTTVTEAFPDLAEKFHPETSNITMVHLLSHRAGLPANLLWGPFDRKDSLIQQRRKATVLGLSSAPRHAPGSRYEYSNLGYVIAGAMIEKALGVTWEEAIEKEVFKPLGMREWGFGGTGTPGRVDQPWGHTTSDKPVRSNGPDCDNPPVLGPAGRVHCSMGDWTLFVADQLRGARGEPAFLKPETYRKLHSPPFGGEYAMGWVTADRSWGGGAVLNHAGCNTMNYATAWLAPRKGFAVLVCVNQGDDIASKASDEAAGALIRIANAPGALEARP